MRVFLSHSSANKPFVRAVFDMLGNANAEFDELTFDAGLFNAETIRRSLDRCDIFALFATPEGLSSGYVQLEANFALEALAKGTLKRVFSFCLQGVLPHSLPNALPQISAITQQMSPGACARFLKSQLIELAIQIQTIQRPFVGREIDIKAIKSELSDPDERLSRSFAFSGIDGVGRRTLAKRLINDIYPNTAKVLPEINFEYAADLRDMIRSLLHLEARMSKLELINELSEFETLTTSRKIERIGDLVNTFYSNREPIIIVDAGGVINTDGSFNISITQILKSLEPRTPPYFIFILSRLPPRVTRPPVDLVRLFRVPALQPEDVQQLVSFHLRSKQLAPSREDIDRLAEMTDGHPYNIQYLLRLIDEKGTRLVLDDPSDLIAFKRRRGIEFISRMKLTDSQIIIIKLLRFFGYLSISTIAMLMDRGAAEISQAIVGLEELHFIDRQSSIISINRPLRTGFFRIDTFNCTDVELKEFTKKLISIFEAYSSDDHIEIALISAATKAALLTDGTPSIALYTLLIPSHEVYIANIFYDQKQYKRCADLCGQTIIRPDIEGEDAWLEAVVLRALSLARLGEKRQFDETINRLRHINSPRIKEKLLFLEGFWQRLTGELLEAKEKFLIAHSMNRRSFSTLRELSYTLIQLDENEEAEKYARIGFEIKPMDPYNADIYLAAKLAQRKVSRDIFYDPEISDLLDTLRNHGDEEGMGFYNLRMADLYRRMGSLTEAMEWANKAVDRAPWLYGAHRVQAELYLKQRLFGKFDRKLEVLQRLLDDQQGGGKTYLPNFLRLKIDACIETDKLDDAVSLLRVNQRRLQVWVDDYKRRIAFAASQSKGRLDRDNRNWISKSDIS
jgi:tetratricopeptide (TPR) repeat protein